jgi:hypothetical protein
MPASRRLSLALPLAGALLALPALASANPPRGFTEVSSGDLTAIAGVQTHATVSCPAGTVPLGGGVATTLASGVTVNGTYPTATGWAADVNNPDATNEAFSVDVTCSHQPRGYTIVTANDPAPAGQETFGEAMCPNATASLGGGARSSSAQLSVNLSESLPTRSRWNSGETNASAVDSQLTTFVVCGKLKGYDLIAGTHTPLGPGNTVVGQSCPAGQVATDGGVATDDSRVLIGGTFPDANGWDVVLRNGAGSGVGYRPFLICVGG